MQFHFIVLQAEATWLLYNLNRDIIYVIDLILYEIEVKVFYFSTVKPILVYNPCGHKSLIRVSVSLYMGIVKIF